MPDYPTLVDAVKSCDNHGNLLDVAEIMETRGVARVVKDAPMIRGNLVDGIGGTVRDGLPTISARRLNKGTAPTKSSSRKLTDTVSIYEARAHIDVETLALYKDPSRYRLQEAKAFLEAMNREVVTDIFMGTRARPDKILGLAGRDEWMYSDCEQVIDAGYSGLDAMSVYLIGWGEDTIGLFYGENQVAGLSHVAGKEPISVQDSDNNYFDALKDLYTWRLGLYVKDRRYGVRICNINPANVTGLENLMSAAYEQLPSIEGVNPVFYVPKKIKIAFNNLANSKANHFFSMQERFGKPCTHFYEIPVERCDVLGAEVSLPKAA